MSVKFASEKGNERKNRKTENISGGRWTELENKVNIFKSWTFLGQFINVPNSLKRLTCADQPKSLCWFQLPRPKFLSKYNHQVTCNTKTKTNPKQHSDAGLPFPPNFPLPFIYICHYSHDMIQVFVENYIHLSFHYS